MESREVLPPAWPVPTRILFRFWFCYWVAYLFPEPLGEFLYGTQWLADLYRDGLYALVPWIGEHVLGIDVVVQINGSGDTTFYWVLTLITLVVAVIATVVWSVLDRGRTAYPRLHEGMRIYLRYCLFGIMMIYGLAKISLTQFPFPGPERLVQTYGESSPMRLLWTFMGASEGYNYVTGAIEVVAGLLFLSRRTTTLGALLTCGVMANIMALNFFYDVPVKLFSSHIFLMAAFLAAPQARRLIDFFVLDRPASPSSPRPWRGPRWFRRASLGLKLVVVLWISATLIVRAVDNNAAYGPDAPRPALHGLYQPIDANGPWSYLVIGGYRQYPMVTVRDRAGQATRYQMAYDQAGHVLTLTDKDGGEHTLQVTEKADGGLALSGKLGDVEVDVQLRLVDPDQFPLVNRGFHWINEFPYNR